MWMHTAVQSSQQHRLNVVSGFINCITPAANLTIFCQLYPGFVGVLCSDFLGQFEPFHRISVWYFGNSTTTKLL
jgi:hypothetical protein